MVRIRAKSGVSQPVVPGQSVVLSGKTLLGDVSLQGQRLQHFAAVGCTFRACSFANLICDDFTFAAGIGPTEYVDCDFSRVKLRVGSVGPARFVNCRFENADITGLLSFMGEFINCTFSGKLRKAVFYGTVAEDWRTDSGGRAANKFTGNDFSRAEFLDVAFRGGIDLSQQKLPTGDAYVVLRGVPDRIAAIERTLQQRQEPLSEAARGFIRWLAFESSEGQIDLLLKRPLGGFSAAQHEVLALFMSSNG